MYLTTMPYLVNYVQCSQHYNNYTGWSQSIGTKEVNLFKPVQHIGHTEILIPFTRAI